MPNNRPSFSCGARPGRAWSAQILKYDEEQDKERDHYKGSQPHQVRECICATVECTFAFPFPRPLACQQTGETWPPVRSAVQVASFQIAHPTAENAILEGELYHPCVQACFRLRSMRLQFCEATRFRENTSDT